MRCEREASRVRRSMLRGKLERWAPTTARSMVVVVVVVWLLLAMVRWVDGLDGVWEGGGEFWLERIVVCLGFNAVHMVGVAKDPGRIWAFRRLRRRCKWDYVWFQVIKIVAYRA